MFEGFITQMLHPLGEPIHLRTGGQGPPLLLLHGHPQTHAMWHRVAPTLAQHFSVVAADLRGYGQSSRPIDDGSTYSKRRMAAEMHTLMSLLGHTRYAVLAHDRGARAAHRLALDQPAAVSRLMWLDIAPTLDMFAATSEAFARAYWHWFFLIQPAALPERLIEADPVAYLRDVMVCRHGGLAVFDPAAWADYAAAIQRPGSAAAICADYRASAGIDLEHDRADRAQGHRLTMPVAVLWGEHSTVGRCFDPMALWRAAAHHVRGQSVPGGHYIAEAAPLALLDHALPLFTETPR